MSELVYKSDRAEVYWGEAEDILPQLGRETAHLLLTDPPYGAEWQSGRRHVAFDPIANDTPADREVIREVIRQALRVLKRNRHLYVFGPPDAFQGTKVSEVTELIWDKVSIGQGDLTAAWGPAHETINFAVSKHVNAGQAGRSCLPVVLRKGSVLRHQRPTGRNVRHPSEKPVPLLRELIESSSRQGETVLDPFSGTGATGVAAILSGRRVVLIDNTEKWARMSVERVQAAEAVALSAEVAWPRSTCWSDGLPCPRQIPAADHTPSPATDGLREAIEAS